MFRNMMQAEQDVFLLKDELEGLKQKSTFKEQELRLEIEKLRRMNKNLEIQLSCLSMGRCMVDDETMELMKTQHQNEVKALQSQT